MRDKIIEKGYYLPLILALILSILYISAKGQSKKEIYKYCVKSGLDHPDIVTAQIYYETAHLTSDVFKENKNLFGMKVPMQRNTFAVGENRGYAVYRTWKQSIRDYRLWQMKYYKGGDYYKFLVEAGYSTNEEYCKTLKQIKI